MDINEIKKLALAFREAFESTDLTQAPGALSYFPKGCCSWSSLFIANFLIDNYGLSPNCIYAGFHINGSQHEWIELNGIVVDITADQFGDAPSAVIVEVNSLWHSKFRDCNVCKEWTSVDKYDSIGSAEKISAIYEKIVSKVRKVLAKSEGIEENEKKE